MIERSQTGQGRKSDAKVWIREKSTIDELVDEANSRNRPISWDSETYNGNQSDLPKIWGGDWRPVSHLRFNKAIDPGELSGEILRFTAERWDGYLELVRDVLEDCVAPKSMNGEDFHKWSELFCDLIYDAFEDRLHTSKINNVLQAEIMPRRDGRLYLSRKRTRLILDLRLLLRRLAYLSSITKEERIHWHRLMIRTRILDRHLKELFVEGVETPDGTKFGGKGFRSILQEPIAACGTALHLGKDVAAP